MIRTWTWQSKILGRHVLSGLEGFLTKSLYAIKNDDEIMTAAMTCRQPNSASSDRVCPPVESRRLSWDPARNWRTITAAIH